jgi:hypothetical protein
MDGIKGGLLSPLTFYNSVSEYLNRDRPAPDTAAGNQRLLANIDSLPITAQKLDFLSEEEIQQFRVVISLMPTNEKIKWEKKLATYIEYTRSECAFTLNSMPELDQPITVEATFGRKAKDRNYIHTYDLDSFKNHIKIACQGKRAFEPTTRDFLNDENHIKIYKGFAREIYQFVGYVRAALRNLFGNKQKVVAKPIMQSVAQPSQLAIVKQQASPVFFKPENKIMPPILSTEHPQLLSQGKPSPAPSR